MSDELAVDPEEAFVASLSSRLMFFLFSIAAKQNYIADRYQDHAEGIMGEAFAEAGVSIEGGRAVSLRMRVA